VSGYGVPRLLSAGDDRTDFGSGEPVLDDWLRRRAMANSASGASRCFVSCRDCRVAGFYALSTGSVQLRMAPAHVGHGMPDPVPVVLLGRLAVDRRDQGHGLGSGLLRDAVARTVAASEIVGVRALLVHAMNERARDFYLRFDFEPSPVEPLHLMLLMKDARKAIEGLRS